jgi:hypothetical protein
MLCEDEDRGHAKATAPLLLEAAAPEKEMPKRRKAP